MYFLIIFVVIIVLAAFITIDNDLRILKQKQFHEAIEHSRFLRLMDLIFNKYFEWRLWIPTPFGHSFVTGYMEVARSLANAPAGMFNSTCPSPLLKL
jgi:hypothetical protein